MLLDVAGASSSRPNAARRDGVALPGFATGLEFPVFSVREDH